MAPLPLRRALLLLQLLLCMCECALRGACARTRLRHDERQRRAIQAQPMHRHQRVVPQRRHGQAHAARDGQRLHEPLRLRPRSKVWATEQSMSHVRVYAEWSAEERAGSRASWEH